MLLPFDRAGLRSRVAGRRRLFATLAHCGLTVALAVAPIAPLLAAGTSQHDPESHHTDSALIQKVPRPHILVRFQSSRALPGEVMIEAQDRVTRIFEEIGVSMTWVNDRHVAEAGSRAFVIAVNALSGESERGFLANAGLPARALGAAIPNAARAYLFFGRIDEMATVSRQCRSVLFGRVLAHEMGHLVLPGAGHSRTGIMQSEMLVGGQHDPGFTPSQGVLIRSLLTSGRPVAFADDPS